MNGALEHNLYNAFLDDFGGLFSLSSIESCSHAQAVIFEMQDLQLMSMLMSASDQNAKLFLFPLPIVSLHLSYIR